MWAGGTRCDRGGVAGGETMKIDPRRVNEVRFEIVVDGKRRAAVFLRRSKIDEIMGAKDPIGEFLHALATEGTN